MNNKNLKILKSQMPFHLMLIPGLLFLLVYSYGPMFGIIMAFQKYVPIKGFFKSTWVGLDNFEYIFKMPDFTQAFYNTLYIAVLKIIFALLIPLLLALLINEISNKSFNKSIQTIIFVPYFLSWAILGGVIIEMFSLSGPINNLLSLFGIEPIMFMTNNTAFPLILVGTDVWKGMGYNMIVFLAAITNIDPTLYEASSVDGASKWKQTLNITLPGMSPIIILLATLSLGGILNAGFEQVQILINPVVHQSGDIIDTLVYRMGINNAQYSPAAAIGLFKSGISLILVSISYYMAYKFSDYRIF